MLDLSTDHNGDKSEEPQLLVLIPAYNEELSVGDVIASVQEVLPDVPVVVVGFDVAATCQAACCLIMLLLKDYYVGFKVFVMAGGN